MRRSVHLSLDTPFEQPTVRLARFDLRPIRAEDSGLWAFYAGDRRVAEMTAHIPHPLPPGAAEAVMARAAANDRTKDVWVMDARRLGGADLMGVITLDRMDSGQSEISYWVAPQFWNSKLASEAVSGLVEANPLDNASIFAAVFQDNPASARVLTNCGFEYIGDAELHCTARDSVLDSWTYVKPLRGAPSL